MTGGDGRDALQHLHESVRQKGTLKTSRHSETGLPNVYTCISVPSAVSCYFEGVKAVTAQLGGPVHREEADAAPSWVPGSGMGAETSFPFHQGGGLIGCMSGHSKLLNESTPATDEPNSLSSKVAGSCCCFLGTMEKCYALKGQQETEIKLLLCLNSVSFV